MAKTRKAVFFLFCPQGREVFARLRRTGCRVFGNFPHNNPFVADKYRAIIDAILSHSTSNHQTCVWIRSPQIYGFILVHHHSLLYRRRVGTPLRGVAASDGIEQAILPPYSDKFESTSMGKNRRGTKAEGEQGSHRIP